VALIAFLALILPNVSQPETAADRDRHGPMGFSSCFLVAADPAGKPRMDMDSPPYFSTP
jgi:hypothetical protein